MEQKSSPASANTVVPNASPVGIFQGYDTVTCTGLSMALIGQTQTTGGYSCVSYRVCSGIQELSEEMGVTQSSTASFWSIASISQKLQFVNSLNLTTHSTCIVVSAKHTTGKETATNWRLNPNIEPPRGNTELLNFFRVYGDSFLASRTLGGEYYAVYTFYAESQERQSELIRELHAEGLVSVVSIDASVQARLSKMSSTQMTRVSLDLSISGIANPKFPDADHIIQFGLDFPSLPLTSPVVTDWETTGYERVPGIGTDFDVIAANRRSIVGLTPRLFLLKQLQNDINDINDIYCFYGGYDADTRLVQVKREADEDTMAVHQMIAAYEGDPTETLRTPELRSLANGNPSLRYEIHRTHSFVGGAGEPFDDIDGRSYLQKKTRISAIQFRFFTHFKFVRVIRYFMVTYTDTNGSRVIEHGRGHAGKLTDELVQLPGPVVISAISGNIVSASATDHFWRSIGFEFSDGREVFFGHSEAGYRWAVPQSSFLLGFSGRFGSHLAELQFVYASFRPAFWTAYPKVQYPMSRVLCVPSQVLITVLKLLFYGLIFLMLVLLVRFTPCYL